MKNIHTETINTEPAHLWPFLAPPRWPLWLAADGPLPRIEAVEPGQDSQFTLQAADGQTAMITVEKAVADTLLVYRLEYLVNGPWQVQQVNTLSLAQVGPGATELTWECEWQRDYTGWRDWLMNWLLYGDVAEMMDIALWNLKALAEETNDDHPIFTGPAEPEADSDDGT